ncbi:aminoglycoside 6-adenylyltransferase [Enterovibrio coralii]|uniref:Oxalate:formate antiporter n=1 Tax=Enterovibrio coralii TaxID=294935 RepID=A0A135I9C5_9GAMM|nr:aminoglycoside 6-adenylyltransferase [Enterovibrio coralii]KXF82055.1 oxalate:formate antiporter [Enterovibrio coralii]
MKYPHSLPQAHKQLLDDIIRVFSADPRVVGIGASGSFASDSMDDYSDLDIVIAVEPTHFDGVMKERFQLIDKVNGRVSGFTGEHVGEPRLIITMFEPNTLHVDFKFVSLPDAAVRVDDTQVLWEKDSCLTDTFATREPHYPQPNAQWIEDRFWTWIHYAGTKIARGEYFETLEFISFLRHVALSPLALQQAGLTPSGVRKIETRLPDFAEKLRKTVALPEKASLISAMTQCIEIYRELRSKESVKKDTDAETAAMAFWDKEFSK